MAGGSVNILAERLLRREEAWAEARGSKAVTSDNVLVAAADAAGLTVATIPPVDAGMLARLGWRKIQVGETVSPEELEANYIRRSDAEIFAKGSS